MIAICYIIKGSKNQVKEALDKKKQIITRLLQDIVFTP